MSGNKLLYLSNPRQATWLELFFDLIFVVALGKLTHLLAHVHDGHLDPRVWLHLLLGFVPMWWIWVGHTVFSNRFDADTRPHRVATLLLMFLIMLASVFVGDGLMENHVPFVIVYSLARLLISGFYFFAARRYPAKAKFAAQTGINFFFGAIISGAAILLPLPAAVLVFYAGILFDVVARRFIVTQRVPVDRDHLVERVGLLAIIMLGESVISISSSLADVVWNPMTVTTAVFGFLLICMIWWIYFDSFPLLIESKRDVNGDAILVTQLLTYISFAVLANLISHAILDDLGLGDFRIMVIVGVVMFYMGKQIAYYVNCPEYRPWIWLNTVVMFSIVGISLLSQIPQFILFGTVFSMMVYIAMAFFTQRKLYGHAHL